MHKHDSHTDCCLLRQKFRYIIENITRLEAFLISILCFLLRMSDFNLENRNYRELACSNMAITVTRLPGDLPRNLDSRIFTARIRQFS